MQFLELVHSVLSGTSVGLRDSVHQCLPDFRVPDSSSDLSPTNAAPCVLLCGDAAHDCCGEHAPVHASGSFGARAGQPPVRRPLKASLAGRKETHSCGHELCTFRLTPVWCFPSQPLSVPAWNETLRCSTESVYRERSIEYASG